MGGRREIDGSIIADHQLGVTVRVVNTNWGRGSLSGEDIRSKADEVEFMIGKVTDFADLAQETINNGGIEGRVAAAKSAAEVADDCAGADGGSDAGGWGSSKESSMVNRTIVFDLQLMDTLADLLFLTSIVGMVSGHTAAAA